jgi:UDP-MurNAc hydroxylase
MLVEFLGHAGFMVTHGHTRVACDPWLSPLGAYHVSWFQLPCNHRLWERDYRELTAVVITNDRQDHLDAAFLAQKLAPETPLIVPGYPSRALWNKIRRACPNPIVEVKPGSEHPLGEGLRVLFTAEDSPDSRNAAVTFLTREAHLVAMSNARLKAKQRQVLKDRLRGRIDALLVQSPGAGWDPICFRYSDERLAARSSGKRIAKLEDAFQALDLLAPRIGLPYAGPPAFLEASLFRFNEDRGGKGLLADQQRSQAWLRQRGYTRRLEIPLPGDRLNLISGEFEPEQRIRQEFSFDQKEEYLKAYAERMRPALTAYLKTIPPPTDDLFEPLAAYCKGLGALPEKMEMDLRFVIEGPHGGDFLVHGRSGELIVERTPAGLPDEEAMDRPAPLTLYLDAVWLNQILKNDLPWEDFFLSLRFAAEHDPEVSPDELLTWLKVTDAQEHPCPLSPSR